MSELFVVKTDVIEPVLRGNPKSQLWLESRLEAAGLPTILPFQLEGIVPLYSAERFLCDLASELGDEVFNYRSVTEGTAATTEQVANIALPLGETGLGFDIVEILKASGTLDAGKSPLEQGLENRPVATAECDDLSGFILKMQLDGHSDNLCERAAGAFGISQRTYQRRLAKTGLTHSMVRDRARMRAALDWIGNSNLSITSIALDLGYAQSGDFTRFFRKQTGLTPTQYRQML